MYKSPTKKDFEIITNFWEFEIKKGIVTKNTSILIPYQVVIKNIYKVNIQKELFTFKMSNNKDTAAIMHFSPITSNIFNSRTYEEAIIILAINSILIHVKINTPKKIFFHSNYKFILEAMFTIKFNNYTISPVGSSVKSICAQKII